VQDVSEKLVELRVKDAVIVGLEAHVCVQQTTLDLLELGINAHLCVDAISSQSPTDRSCGLHRAGAPMRFERAPVHRARGWVRFERAPRVQLESASGL